MNEANAADPAPTQRVVSVILPTFNREATLPRAIASVLGQTHVDLELIVVDDGSTDGTSAVLASFEDPRMRVIRVDGNRGANHARNLGIREARTELLAFMDSDDAWLPHKLTAQLAVMDAEGDDVGLVFSPHVRRRDGGVDIVGADLVGLPHDKQRTPSPCDKDTISRHERTRVPRGTRVIKSRQTVELGPEYRAVPGPLGGGSAAGRAEPLGDRDAAGTRRNQRPERVRVTTRQPERPNPSQGRHQHGRATRTPLTKHGSRIEGHRWGEPIGH